MILPTLTALFAAGSFALATYFLYKRGEEIKQLMLEREELQRQKLFELSVLKELQERIGYSLDLEKVVDVLTSSLHNFFKYSTASSLIIKNGSLIFTTHLEEPVSIGFLEKVKESMIASLSTLSNEPLPEGLKENVTGATDQTNTSQLASFFHIPLIINEKVVGLINLSSTQPGLYKEQEMTMMYQITGLASNALSKLNEVLSTEEGKIIALIGSLTDGVFMVDHEKEILVINDSAKHLLGITKPTTPAFFDLISQIDKNYDLAGNIEKSLTGFNQVPPQEIQIGKRFVRIYLTTVAHARKDSTGGREIYGVAVILHDITLQRNLSRMKEDFTHMIVHELRAPLTAIKGASSLIETAPKIKEEEKKKLLHTIYEQAKELLDEVNSLLDAAKLESGNFSLVKSPHSIKNLVEERIQFFMPEATTKNIHMENTIPSSLPLAMIDSFRIGQVLNNLLSNSLKFSKENGHITVSAKVQGKDLLVSVADTGVGIPHDKQAQLFTKYSQASQEARILGTGLGLYIAKGIIEAHGGKIMLESEKDKGTTVYFTIPIDQTQQTKELKPHYLISPHPFRDIN